MHKESIHIYWIPRLPVNKTNCWKVLGNSVNEIPAVVWSFIVDFVVVICLRPKWSRHTYLRVLLSAFRRQALSESWLPTLTTRFGNWGLSGDLQLPWQFQRHSATHSWAIKRAASEPVLADVLWVLDMIPNTSASNNCHMQGFKNNRLNSRIVRVHVK